MYLKKLIVSAIVFVLLDFSYLFSMRTAFEQQVVKIQGSPLSLNWVSTLLCYVFLIGGLYYFILRENRGWKEAAILGFVIYGVYDTTTLSLFKNWSWTTALFDIIWGTLLFSLTTVITYKVENLRLK